MKKFKILPIVALIFCVCFGLVSCGMNNNNNNNNNPDNTGNNPQVQQMAEKVELSKTTLGDVEFENADTVKIDDANNIYSVKGTINAMTDAQITAYGVPEVTHAVALKLTFDKEKTLSECKIQGNTTKVFSTDKNAENYVGSISDLLDSEDEQDAFCYLVLSANTEEYTITATYSDKTTSVIKLNIEATLATSDAE